VQRDKLNEDVKARQAEIDEAMTELRIAKARARKRDRTRNACCVLTCGACRSSCV